MFCVVMADLNAYQSRIDNEDAHDSAIERIMIERGCTKKQANLYLAERQRECEEDRAADMASWRNY